MPVLKVSGGYEISCSALHCTLTHPRVTAASKLAAARRAQRLGWRCLARIDPAHGELWYWYCPGCVARVVGE